MKLAFCCVCGITKDLQQHHILPAVWNSGNRSRNDLTITVCATHHDMIHEVQKNRKLQHNNLVREGQQRAKERGVKLGRPTKVTRELSLEVKKLRDNVVGIKTIAKTLQIGVGTVYNILQQLEKERLKELKANPPTVLNLFTEEELAEEPNFAKLYEW